MSNKLKLLLIEDDASTLDQLKFDISELEISEVIHTATNGKEALDLYYELDQKGDDVDLIISDIVMPTCDGVDFVRQFRERHDPDKKKTIIMLTSKSDKNLVLKCLSFGVSQYLLKPWNKQELMQKIMLVLENK
jgi:YesN/AraC family two-component response regulator